ncbi:biotin--[acetyl-CoA-carboxylase] ligase [uncultured Erythrobacter sp.]|uniref:biotin--[acetyl-CoA-carboxylase] ligase n=1 Tax=uncultured Erythrobacter sp. TaxID=263913 RepID=UPI0026323918|nr:biotin--[acetyl-CoA-carboxylase] ligase [uncultured Erythrobacter sp.]
MSNEPLIEVVEETGSTNADLLARVSGGETVPDNSWLMAERQTGGRGRLGRKWDSPKGNLLCSTIVNLVPDDPAPSTLSLVVGLAVFETIEGLLLPDTPMLLKWPNDVLIDGAKVAGILLERHGQSVVVGVGMNLSHAPDLPDRKTTCIVYENGKFENGPRSVLPILAHHLAERLAMWREAPLSDTLLDWTVISHRYNDKMRITGADGEVMHGRYRGIDREGALRVRPIGGRETIVHAGDVTLDWHDKE